MKERKSKKAAKVKSKGNAESEVIDINEKARESALKKPIRKRIRKLNIESMKTNTFSRSIRAKVFFLAAILIITAIAVNYLFISYYARKTVLDNTKSSLYDLADAHLVSVEKTVTSINNALIGLAGETAISDYINGAVSDPADCAKLFQNYLELHKEVDTCSILDANGVVLYSTASSELKASYGDQEFIQKALETRKPTQSSIVTAPSSTDKAITFAYPLVSFLGDAIGMVTVTIPVSDLFENLLSVGVFGTKDSYAYLVDEFGNVLFHKDEDLIGTKDINQKIIDLTAKMNDADYASKIADGSADNVKVDTYKDNGKVKHMSLAVTPTNKWALVVVADDTEVTKPIARMSIITIILSAILVMILSFIGFLFADSIVRPIKRITQIMNQTASLSLTDKYDYSKLMKSKDETGSMASAMQKLRSTFSEIVEKIKNSSDHINENASDLNSIMNSVKEHAGSNAAATQELSASMEETFATAEEISSSIEQMDNNTKDIALQIKDGTVLSKQLAQRAKFIKEDTVKASDSTKSIYDNMKLKTEEAIKRAESVSKINTLAYSIKEIAEQTSLLSLNASIEAARAGDSGRGFGVVASEIGKLANQSSETVSNITIIVDEVNETVKDLTSSLEKTLAFLGNNVLDDYQKFIDVSEQYTTDASQMNDNITSIHNSVKIVIQYMESISHAVTGITSNVGDATASVTNIADGNNQIMNLTIDTYNRIKVSEELAAKLQEVVNQFELS